MATLYTSARQIAIDKTIHGKRAVTKSKVDLLGTLDDEYKTARGARDPAALLAVAAKYLAVGCPNKAYQIRAEVSPRRHGDATDL